jgi:hypothetical protein
MIRILTAWTLLVLAASPFTAPFTTCDVGMLVRQPPPILVVSAGHAVQSVAIPASNGDATTIAPPVTRTHLEQDQAVVLCDARALALTYHASIAIRHSLRDSGHAPDESPPKSLAMRL